MVDTAPFLDILHNEVAKLELMPKGTSSKHFTLASGLRMGKVVLRIASIERELQFYKDLVGLDILSQKDDFVVLGFEKQEIVVLEQDRSLPPFNHSSAGLYHLAIVFESRATLAAAIERILTVAPQLYQGSADHLVSEAFYFADPEGNGVELYFDKNPQTWHWVNGRVVMDSLYLDEHAYITQYKADGGDSSKTLGHIHLQVGDIKLAREFYTQLLGFTITAEFPSALFLSDGVYHHHIGMNTWHSRGSKERALSLGLHNFEVVLPDQDSFTLLKQHLEKHSISMQPKDTSFLVKDPWNNEIKFRVNVT